MTSQTFESIRDLTGATTTGAVVRNIDLAAPTRVLATILGYAGLGTAAERRATGLLARFGSLASILYATPQELADEGGLPAQAVAVLMAVAAVHRVSLRERLPERVRIDTPEALLDFLAGELRYRRDEAALAVFLDADFRVIAVEVIAVGSVNHCPLTVRQVVERALAHGASALVLAHNHPSGNLDPSSADVTTTHNLQTTLANLDIDLLEHVIIGDGAYSVLRGERLA
ncbi:MAG: hypothetical protein EA356_05980 [Geminicoccaceae bacterium]|nr:MAG: hypothetical protein EA356_05980 [Geminicoccaceae bacterium]